MEFTLEEVRLLIEHVAERYYTALGKLVELRRNEAEHLACELRSAEDLVCDLDRLRCKLIDLFFEIKKDAPVPDRYKDPASESPEEVQQ